MYIEHVIINTGARQRAERAGVADAALAALLPWLESSLAARQPSEIPGCDGYRAQAVAHGPALVVTVYGPKPDVGGDEPICTFGVATRARNASKLWDLLVDHFDTPPNTDRPGTPWCATVYHLSISRHSATHGWIADFQRCIAWAWVSRRPSLAAVE